MCRSRELFAPPYLAWGKNPSSRAKDLLADCPVVQSKARLISKWTQDPS
jgi:hypothetical protein